MYTMGSFSWESHRRAKDHEHWDKQETISAMSAFTRIINIYFSCYNKFYAFLAATSPAPPPAREGHFTINFTMTNLLYTSAFENPNSKQSLATKKALTYLVSVTHLLWLLPCWFWYLFTVIYQLALFLDSLITCSGTAALDLFTLDVQWWH